MNSLISYYYNMFPDRLEKINDYNIFYYDNIKFFIFSFDTKDKKMYDNIFKSYKISLLLKNYNTDYIEFLLNKDGDALTEFEKSYYNIL